MSSKITEEQYRAIGDARDLFWNGTEMPNRAVEKTEWKCKICDYKWETTYSNITHKTNPTGCPNCSGKRKKTIDDYEAVGENLDLYWNAKIGLLISKKIPKTVNHTTDWACKVCNYTWRTSYSHIVTGSSRCPSCSGLAKLTIAEYNRVIDTRTLCWDSKQLPRSVNHKTEWSCTICSHKWSETYNKIVHSGRGCPKCAITNRTGENHHNWKGGITPENVRTRSSSNYKQWRTDVFERDNYTCQCCKERGGKLHAHHLEDFASNEELRMDLDNGVTMCEECHTRFHNWNGGYINPCTKADYTLFISYKKG